MNLLKHLNVIKVNKKLKKGSPHSGICHFSVVPVKPRDISWCALNNKLLVVLKHMSGLFMVVFPSEPVVLPEHLFCFCSGFWKECVSNIDEPCQRRLDDASSYTTTPRCLESFTNTLSSLFGALLVWHHAGHVHQKQRN